MNQTNTGRRRMASPNAILAMLMLVYTFNFLDRQILSIVAQQVKADLHVSDTQMGLLGGLAFALLYATLAIPFGVIADRKGRSRVIAVSLAVWSGFTALCGAVTGFWQLFLCRLGVGIGEAGGVAPSYAILADTFPHGRKARALAIYSLGVPLGVATGALFGSMIAQAVDWRAAFFVLGAAGLAIVVPFRRIVPDQTASVAALGKPAMAVFRHLAGLPVFWLLSVGAALGSLYSYGISFWAPSLLQRSYDLTLVETGQFLGALQLIGGVPGMLAGGMLADRFGSRDKASYPRVAGMAFLLCLPAFAAAFSMRDTAWLFVMLIVPSGLIYLWLGSVVTAIQHLVPASDRATASACYLLMINGIGLGLGSLTMGKLSDMFAGTHGTDSLRLAAIATTLVFLAAAALLFLAAPRLREAWID